MNHLTQHQIDQIRQALRERERTMRKEIREGLLRSGEERYKDMAGAVSDTGDESVADLLADVEIAGIERDVRELRNVEAALIRMASGEFGVCTACGAEISHARLHSNPASARCITCQDRHERSHAFPKASSL